MCGIIARIGPEAEARATLETLRLLEYRGYDSWGALVCGPERVIRRGTGSIDGSSLRELGRIVSRLELGHTRWATHGRVSVENAHPHTVGSWSVVMNGIVENEDAIRARLAALGARFSSETDTELVAHLLDRLEDASQGSLDALFESLEGSLAFVATDGDRLIVARRSAPLVAGLRGGSLYVCSDLPALSEVADRVAEVPVGVSIVADPSDLDLKWRDPVRVERRAAPSGTWMEREILDGADLGLDRAGITAARGLLRGRVVLTGAGTSHHAALLAEAFLLDAGIDARAVVASELERYLPFADVVVAFSQSGETADLIGPLESARVPIVAIVNVEGSTLDRLASRSVRLACGPEYAVASTKSFVQQVRVAAVLAGRDLAFDAPAVIAQRCAIRSLARRLALSEHLFFIGAGLDAVLAREAALKVKETSYVHAEGFAAAELKHGALALVESGTPVVALGSGIEHSAREVEARGGIVTRIGSAGIVAPALLDRAIAVQLLALETALALGRAPDRPRNLAKAVTVR